MAPTTSDGPTTHEEVRTFQGNEVRVRLDPDEVFVQWRPRRPVYIGVRVGDRIKAADRDVSSPRIDEWDVTEITADTLTGVHAGDGEERVWDRTDLERGLVLGSYATNLSDFALVTAHCVGAWETYDPEVEDTGPGWTYHGEPYLTVVAYGNNGESYGLRYRFQAQDDDVNVEPWERDPAVERLGEDLQTMLAMRVREVLEADGYAVHG